MKILFVADFFLRDGVRGGAELVDDELTQVLSDMGFDIQLINSSLVDIPLLEEQEYDAILVSNFVHLKEDTKEAMITGKNYFIFEHDHKYLKSRNPATYPNQEAPSAEIANESFFKNAAAVFCQTGMHARLLQKNILLDNVVNLTTSIWSEKEMQTITDAQETKKEVPNVIIESSNPIKGTAIAKAFCKQNGMEFESIPSTDFETFVKLLARAKNLVFFPASYESCCRLLVEARMLNCSVTTNSLAGAVHEEWFKLSGKELTDLMKTKKEQIAETVSSVLKSSQEHFLPLDIPKISILTSVYNGDEHIEGFLKDITSQSIFDKCELILVNCNSPGNEREIILKYVEKYGNIVYKELDEDPGIYGAWNLAIELSTGEFLTNANLDDRRATNQIETLARTLMNNSNIDLVYSFSYRTEKPNELFKNNTSFGQVYQTYDFSKENMVKCLPGAMPVWRKSMHERCGLFDESFKMAGDWEMWLRAVDNGSEFRRVEGAHGLYYDNPEGLSTNKEKSQQKFEEEKSVFWKYTHVFGEEMTGIFKDYFSK